MVRLGEPFAVAKVGETAVLSALLLLLLIILPKPVGVTRSEPFFPRPVIPCLLAILWCSTPDDLREKFTSSSLPSHFTVGIANNQSQY